MANKTINLGLILPGNGEFFNVWDQPMNQNWTTVDTAVGAVTDEVVTARGSSDSLNDRLSAALDSEGNLLPAPEVVAARVSGVYGFAYPVGAPNAGAGFQLTDRANQGDLESFYARQQLASLTDGLAWGPDQNKNNAMVSAANNYLTFTGAVVSLNGNVTPAVANINGYRNVVRNILTTPISGSAGTYYLTLTRVPGGVVYSNITANTGTIGVYVSNGLVAMLSDISQNFVTLGVKPGDVLTVNGPVGDVNLNSYIVLATNAQDPTNLTTSQLAVIGEFDAVSTGLNYTLTNPIAPQLGFTATAHAKVFTRVPNVIYLGRCVFDGTNVTSLTTYQNLGVYSGFTSISLTGGNFNISIPHNLGYFPSKVSLYASQASDFSAPLDLLSVAAITGGGSLQRSVIAQMSDLNLLVKNATNGLFYQDFSGANQTSGFLYAVVER